MNKHIPTILLAIICALLSLGLYLSNQEVAALKEKITSLQQVPTPQKQARSHGTIRNSPAGDSKNTPAPQDKAHVAEESAPNEEEKQSPSRRMMSNLDKMMENPTMNKVMEASQRGALSALYEDLIESFQFTGEEKDYFMDLLMKRQMKQVDLGMKMMSGGMSDEEKTKMGKELEEISKTVKNEMGKFLNDADDYEKFTFYEKTMSERMMLSQMNAKLSDSDAAMSDETYRELLGMMHDERNNFEFKTNLHDSEEMDMSAERFSQENLKQFSTDMDELNRQLLDKAGTMLSAEQLSAFEESVQSSTEMQKSQMEMAASMFGKKEKTE